MKNIITLIESELHRRALQAISEEKQGVAKKAFDVPELHEDGDDDNIGEALEPDGAEGEEAKSKQKKNVEGKRQDVKGGKDETAEDEDILTAATTGWQSTRLLCRETWSEDHRRSCRMSP